MLWTQDFARITLILPVIYVLNSFHPVGCRADWIEDGLDQIDEAEAELDDFMIEAGEQPIKVPTLPVNVPHPHVHVPLHPHVHVTQPPPATQRPRNVIVSKKEPSTAPAPPPTTKTTTKATPTTTTTTTPVPPPPTTASTPAPPPQNRKPYNSYPPNTTTQISAYQSHPSYVNRESIRYPVRFPPQSSDDDYIFTGSRRGCQFADTELNGMRVCRGDLIFYEDFNDGTKINKSKWTHEIMMPWAPDYGFVLYQTNSINSFVRGGKLYIKPSLGDELQVTKGRLDLRPIGCTARREDQCTREAQSYGILPPAASARITTKKSVSFKYGTVEIRAKLPVGDWIVPEIWLEPKEHAYGSSPLSSGRIIIAMSRGNKGLWSEKEDIGNKRLEAGVWAASTRQDKFRTLKQRKDYGWGKDYHNFTLQWTPRNLNFLVDGELLGAVCESRHPLYELMEFSRDDAGEWRDGSFIAPFDKEFYISLGVSVGGHRYFPDGSTSNGKRKPWRNFSVKAMSNFWDRRNDWIRSWQLDDSALKVDYVKVTAI